VQQQLLKVLFDGPEDLRTNRKRIRLPQTKLATLAGVPRWRIAFYELGDGELNDSEKERIAAAFESEVSRLRNFSFETTVAGVGGHAA
jgi:predicted transcriptional regulator